MYHNVYLGDAEEEAESDPFSKKVDLDYGLDVPGAKGKGKAKAAAKATTAKPKGKAKSTATKAKSKAKPKAKPKSKACRLVCPKNIMLVQQR